MIWKEDDIQEERTAFFAFTPINIHFRTKHVFNKCQLIIFTVLALLFMSDIVLKCLKL